MISIIYNCDVIKIVASFRYRLLYNRRMEAAAYTDGKMGMPRGRSAYAVQTIAIGNLLKQVGRSRNRICHDKANDVFTLYCC